MAPEGTITEAHAWVITSFGVGNAARSGSAGVVLDSVSVAPAFLIGVLSARAAVLLVFARLRDRADPARVAA